MARRFFLFERLTLPSLLAQTDQDFRIVIMSSDVMPDPFKERLLKVSARLPNAVVDFAVRRRSLFAYKHHMLGPLGPDRKGSAVHFRLDDDDAIAHTLIARLRRLSRDLPPTTHFSFPKGILLFPARAGAPEGTSIVRLDPLTAIGLAYVSDYNFSRNPFAMAHRQVWRDWPVLSDPRFPAYIRTLHFNNDTAARQDLILARSREDNSGPLAAEHASQVDDALTEEFPFIDRTALEDTLVKLAAITCMADLQPID